MLSLESLQIRRNHNWLKSLSFFFSPALRQAIKDSIKPSQEMLDKYSATFLGGKPLGYDLEQLLNAIEEAVKTA